jgi:hypothetical protein
MRNLVRIPRFAGQWNSPRLLYNRAQYAIVKDEQLGAEVGVDGNLAALSLARDFGVTSSAKKPSEQGRNFDADKWGN